MPHAPERIVLVTGASRGIGAEVALRLADPDTHVIVNCRSGTADAEATVEAIRRAGGNASTIAADITDAAETATMMDIIGARFGRLDALILNASGGLDAGTDPGHTTQLNRDAQKRLVTSAVPLMPVGARIVFVTNHQAHFFPNKAVPKGYATVAVAKRAAESALYAMRSMFDRVGIGFTVVSADLIEATVARTAPPVVDEFAAAIANAATTAAAPGIVYVGGAEYLMTA